MDESDHNNLEGNDDNENYSELENKSEREDFEEEDMTFEVLNNDQGGRAIWVNGTCKYLIYCKAKDVPAEEHHNHMLSPEAFLDRRFMDEVQKSICDNPGLPIKTHYRSIARRWTYYQA